MSHFTLMLKLETTDHSRQNITNMIENAMEPFYEQIEDDSPYREFDDHTDEVIKEYENDTVKRVVFNGKMFSKYELDKLKGEDFSKDLPEIDVPIKQVYATIEEYNEDYHSYKNIAGRWGYFHNPNAKWDWYVVGGRWPKKFMGLLKDGKKPLDADFNMVKIGDLDLDKINADMQDELEKLWAVFVEYDYGRTEAPKEDPFKFWTVDEAIERHSFVKRFDKNDPALASCYHVLPENGRQTEYTWAYPSQVTKEEFFAKVFGYCNPIRTYAVLNQDGQWITPGDMGWWGISHAEAENMLEYSNKWMENIILPDIDKNIVLVVVDCHI